MTGWASPCVAVAVVREAGQVRGCGEMFDWLGQPVYGSSSSRRGWPGEGVRRDV